MKRWILFGIGSSAYVSTLIATAPATLIDTGLQWISNGQVRLTETQGTLWSGAGQLEIRDKSRQAGIARALSWKLVPASLLRGRLSYRIGMDTHSQNTAANIFRVTLSRSNVELENMELNVPAAVLGFGVPKLAPLDLGGNMQIHVPHLSFAPNSLEGNATLQWRNIRSGLLPVSPLGDYELAIAGNGSSVQATLHTLEGPLQLDGQGSWLNGHSTRLLATAHLSPPVYQQLAPFLRMVAVEQRDGSFSWIPDQALKN